MQIDQGVDESISSPRDVTYFPPYNLGIPRKSQISHQGIFMYAVYTATRTSCDGLQAIN